MQLRRLLEKKSGSNASEAALQFLKALKIPVTATTAIETVESHPDFPSLYSISDSLHAWKVENAAFQVEPEKLEAIPTPFIAHTRREGGSFVLVKSVNSTVDFINEKGRRERAGKEAFLTSWTNMVLVAEKSADSGEKDFRKAKITERLRELRLPSLAAGGLLLVFLHAATVVTGMAGGIVTAFLLTKLFGCVVTGLLLWFEVDGANPVVQQFCTGRKNTNCTAVLASGSAKLFGWISWSEIGFYYFAGTFLSLLLTAPWQVPAFALLAWLNLAALPYTVFSVSYQWRIARQWCPLCLTVQALLLTEAIICYLGYWATNGLTLRLPQGAASQLIIPFATSLLLPLLFWAAAKKAYLGAQKGRQYKKELRKLKYKKELFAALLQTQKAIMAPTEGLGIMMGNPAAGHTLVKLCNPYCGPCAKAHKVIDELVEEGTVKVQIIFTATNDENDMKALPVKHLLALYERGDSRLTRQALDDWYYAEKKDYETFKRKYPLTDSEWNRQEAKVERMKTWCEELGIAFTPTIFINGYQLPDMYTVQDLHYLL